MASHQNHVDAVRLSNDPVRVIMGLTNLSLMLSLPVSLSPSLSRFCSVGVKSNPSKPVHTNVDQQRSTTSNQHCSTFFTWLSHLKTFFPNVLPGQSEDTIFWTIKWENVRLYLLGFENQISVGDQCCRDFFFECPHQIFSRFVCLFVCLCYRLGRRYSTVLIHYVFGKCQSSTRVSLAVILFLVWKSVEYHHGDLSWHVMVLSHWSHKCRASRLGINSRAQLVTDPALHRWGSTAWNRQLANVCSESQDTRESKTLSFNFVTHARMTLPWTHKKRELTIPHRGS